VSRRTRGGGGGGRRRRRRREGYCDDKDACMLGVSVVVYDFSRLYRASMLP